MTKKAPPKDVTADAPKEKAPPKKDKGDSKAKKKPLPKVPQTVVADKQDAASAFVYRGLTQVMGLTVNSENVKKIMYSLKGDSLLISIGVHTATLSAEQLKLLGYDAKGFAVWLTTKGAKRAAPKNSTRKV